MAVSIHPGSEPTAERLLSAGRESTDTPAQQRHELDCRSAREHTEALLDDALGETFPASDSIAITARKNDSI